MSCLKCTKEVKVYALDGGRYCWEHYVKSYILQPKQWRHVWYKITWELYRKHTK